MLARGYQFLGLFLFGLALAGVPSFAVQIYPQLIGWGWACLIIAVVFLLLVSACDDYLISYLKLEREQFWAGVFSLAASFLVGGVIQWL